MKNKKIILLAASLVLAGLILLVGTAIASTPPPPGNPCGSSGPQGDGVLLVKKDVRCALDRLWTWDILKTGDQSDLTLSTGQAFTVNYTITSTAIVNDSNFWVGGTIFVRNLSTAPVTITGISDNLGTVACGFTFPFVLDPGVLVMCYYNGSPGSAAPENVATVTYGSDQSASATAPIDWSLAAVTETDECVDVTDSFAGPLGTVCADGVTTFTFSYPRELLYGECGEYTVENIASFITNDTGSTGSSSWIVNVDVPCAGGCTLTPGYWKTHSIYGPAPYDDTWALIGEDTPFFLSGKSYYQVLWTAPVGNAYYILGHAYIAAELNFLNGASIPAEVQAAFDAATALFNTYTPEQIAALRGNSLLRKQFIQLADLLDDYNNGLIGPGHCSETSVGSNYLLSLLDFYAPDWVFMPTLAR